uniref:C2 NT-type domain-containing protein n=1 Tax=Globisporangium ultimum (strain ATCC 200006 / CBS 805.95 / DAOM BR144) TaxID=431595 RepID=K3WLB4_GLOUD
MNHLLQVARRTGKHAVGFKIQLVIHRMNAHLSNFNGAELVAVMTRHKKKAVTKSAPYQTAQKEVVWGDILPFSCTLYMAKTGLFQVKIFQVHVYDTRNDQHVATFEFNLAELVQSDKDTGKETITVATSKCQDARASMAITVISSRVGVGGSRGGANDHHEEASEMSFNGSQSEFSVCTLESRTSAASSRRHPQSKSPTSTGRSGTSDDHGKAHNVRGAHPAAANERGDESEDVDAPSQNQKLKHQELMRTLQDLEAQLRHSESANVHLEKEIDLKELQVQQLQVEKQELAEENEVLKRKLSAVEFSAESPSSKSRADSDDGVMQVDFIQYMSLKEEHDKLKLELETLKSTTKTTPAAAATQRESDATQEQEADDKDDDGSSEASYGNDYVDAHDPHLLAENSELKQSAAALSTERDELKDMIATLRGENKQLLAQVKDMQVQTKELIAEIERKNEALALAGPPRASINDMGADSENDDQEQQQEKMSEVKMENEKLMHQLNQLDVVVTKLKNEKSNLLGKLEDAESANERARRDIENAQQTIEQLHGEKENLVGKLQDAEDAHDRAQREIESAELTIAQLREQVQEISAQLEATQQDLHTLKHEELVASVAATAAAVAKNQDLEERWDELQRINSELQTRVEELEDKLVRTAAHEEEEEAELQRQVYELKQETEVLREDLERLRVSKQQAEDELLERTVALKNALETQQRLSIGHEEEVGELTMRNEEMRTRVEQKTEEAQVLTEEWRKKLETLEQENDYFQRELIDSKMKLAELTQQNDELSSQNKKMEKTLLEMKIHAAEKELKEKKEKKEKKK